MLRYIVYLCFMLCSLSLTAQKQFGFRVSFHNKTETSYDLTKPTDYLSSRALARRSIQSIPIDSSDLPVVQKHIDSVLFVSGGIFHSRSKWQNNCVILVEDTSSIHLLRSFSFVKEAKFVALFLSPLHSIVSETKGYTFKQSNNKNLYKTNGSLTYYGAAYDQIKLANGNALHDSGYRGKSKIIAVMDEGFYLVNSLPGYDSLRLSGRLVDSFNFNLNSNSVDGYSSHGTQVLSTMAGILNGDYVGTAPDASYALYVTENSTVEQPFEMDNLVAAMERADSIGADVITISLGYNSFDLGGLDASLSLSDIDGQSTIAAKGANTATQKGILVVASAGNDGNSSWKKILTPGDADSALTCGSVDINKNLAITSGRGPNAAGVRKPDVCMLGAPGVVFNNSGTTSAVGGTSIATPELAGLAACLWETNPGATPYQLRNAIRESAHIASAPDNNMGWGVPDFGKASLSLKPKIACLCVNPDIYTYPNPFNKKISIDMLSTANIGNLNWRMTNTTGQEILKGQTTINSSTHSFEIYCPENLPVGIYFLQFVSEQSNKIVKLEKF